MPIPTLNSDTERSAKLLLELGTSLNDVCTQVLTLSKPMSYVLDVDSNILLKYLQAKDSKYKNSQVKVRYKRINKLITRTRDIVERHLYSSSRIVKTNV